MSSPSHHPPLLALHSLQRLHAGPVDLQIGAGECISLMGQSGAGKSVLLRMVADLDPHAGDALLAGQSCQRMPAPQWRRQVVYVAADSGWWADGVAAHFPRDYDFGRRLPAVGISAEACDWPVARLSTGERQRMALLRALAIKPRVLLLDEPTSGLDADTTTQVEALLRQHLMDGGAILLVTHNPAQAQRMALRHYVIEAGQLRQQPLPHGAAQRPSPAPEPLQQSQQLLQAPKAQP